MFTTLHALAKQATLMITIAPEGDDLLRVNVTPMPFDAKAKSSLPQPLSLLATPTEFDADFIAALATWQAPKRSLIQQAQDAAGGAAPAPALPAPKSEKKDDKPARKARGSKASEGEQKADAAQAPGTQPDSGEQMPADASETSAGASTDAAQDQGTQQAGDEAAGDAGAAGEAQEVVEAAGDAVTAGQVASEPAGEELADKFTLDLF